MAGPRLRVAVAVERIREDRAAIEERLEAAAIEGREARQVVVPHLVDGEEQDEPGRARRAGVPRRPDAESEHGRPRRQQGNERATDLHRNQRSFLTASS